MSRAPPPGPASARLPVAYEAPALGPALAPAVLDRWWLLFNDPVLDALEDEAFATAPDALTAEARVVEARATRNSQVAQTLPTGEISGKASQEREHNIGSGGNALFPIGGVFESETVNLQPSWEIDLFGRLAVARKVAKADLAATRFNIEGSRASLAASVADDYFQATGLAIQIDDARETLRIETGLERVAREKADLGLGAASDADRVAADAAQAVAQLEDLQSQFHAARRALLVLIGRAGAPVESIAISTEVAEAPPPPQALPTELLARRPDIREAEARLRAQVGTGKLRHLAIFPTFTFLPQLGASRTVQPSVGFNPVTQQLFPIQQTTSLGFWTWGGGVTVPLLDIPRLLYDAKAEDARTREAAIAYEKTVQTAFGEAENALVNLAAGKRAAGVLADGEARAHSASEAAQTRYAMGLDDLTTALTAEQAWRTIHSALTSERVQALRRAVAAYKALGGGWAYATRAKAP
ncbi:MAG TPA: TolC family protein [Caulobacteraceae bacterium]|nr:TolC family protein [Caulobacteraceae bacterium]